MKTNAIKFNGPTNAIAQEACEIYDSVCGLIEAQRAELSELEIAVKEQMEGKSRKKRKGGEDARAKAKAAHGTVAKVSGVDVFLGDVSHFHGVESDSDDSYPGPNM